MKSKKTVTRSRAQAQAQTQHQARPRLKSQKSVPPLLFIHGFRGAPNGMQAVFAALQTAGGAFDGRQLKIYAPEMPPARSAGQLDTYDADSYADWVANYIKKHKLDHPILMGHSMGTLIVAATVQKYPELVDPKFILLAPVSQKTPRPIAALQPLVAVLPNRTVSYVTTKYMFVHQADTPATTREMLDQALSLTNIGGEIYDDRRALAAAAKFPAAAVLTNFSFPADRKIYIIAGEHDKLFSQRATKKLAEQWGAQLTILPNCGHLLNYEQPVKLAATIKQVLAD